MGHLECERSRRKAATSSTAKPMAKAIAADLPGSLLGKRRIVAKAMARL
jgi:hypothetical protein